MYTVERRSVEVQRQCGQGHASRIDDGDPNPAFDTALSRIGQEVVQCLEGWLIEKWRRTLGAKHVKVAARKSLDQPYAKFFARTCFPARSTEFFEVAGFVEEPLSELLGGLARGVAQAVPPSNKVAPAARCVELAWIPKHVSKTLRGSLDEASLGVVGGRSSRPILEACVSTLGLGCFVQPRSRCSLAR